MECTICNLQYVNKNKAPFKIRSSNHREGVKKPQTILADKRFQKNDHRFNEYARFTIVHKLTNTNLDKEIFKEKTFGYKN